MHKIKCRPPISVAVGCCLGVDGLELDGRLAAEGAGCPLIPQCCDRWHSRPPTTNTSAVRVGLVHHGKPFVFGYDSGL